MFTSTLFTSLIPVFVIPEPSNLFKAVFNEICSFISLLISPVSPVKNQQDERLII